MNNPLDYGQRTRVKLETETFTDSDGALRWNSNPTSVISLSVFKDAGVTPPAAQASAYERYLTESLAACRKAQEGYVPSAEEMFEMRAAFGPGAKVVNVITGKEIQL